MFTKEQITIANKINTRIENLGEELACLYEKYTVPGYVDNSFKLKWEFYSEEIDLTITHYSNEDDNLTTTTNNIKIPLEYLWDESFDENDDYLVKEHPLIHHITMKLIEKRNQRHEAELREKERKDAIKRQYYENQERQQLAHLQAKYGVK